MMEDGRWKMEDGSWKMEDGRWKMDEQWLQRQNHVERRERRDIQLMILKLKHYEFDGHTM
jgi:hypothetical protein